MDHTIPKPFVFVLMPFSDDFDDVYQLGIKPACEDVGAYAERVDEQLYQGSILQRIYNQIAKADIIISDMTGQNPNVFYETGYAYALGKHVILETQREEDIPFDLKHYPIIFYGGKITDLIPKLSKRVAWAIEHPEGVTFPPEYQVQFYIDGVSVINMPVIEYPLSNMIEKSVIDLTIDVNNSIERYLKSVSFQPALVTAAYFSKSTGSINKQAMKDLTVILLPEGKRLHLYDNQVNLSPGGWASLNVQIEIPSSAIWEKEEPISLRMFSELGILDYPFKIRFGKIP